MFAKFLDYIKPDDTVLNIIRRRQEFSKLQKELEIRINVVSTGLSSCGLTIKQLKTEECIQLLYQSYNPEISNVQKIDTINKYAVTKGNGDFLVE